MTDMLVGDYGTVDLPGPLARPGERQAEGQAPVQAPVSAQVHAPSGPASVLRSGLPLAFSDGRPLPVAASRSRARDLRLKRLFDIAAGSAALFALAPLLFFVAFAIRLTSKGPALFRQQRVGLNGELFELYKFRTMALEDCDESGVNQTVAGDSRVTPVGRFLRATSIDELPQLLNIVQGSMSVVGPRPMVAGQLAAGRPYRELVPYYDYRFAMKPGLTGWAQCHGLRGPTQEAEPAIARVDHDCAYIQNFSFRLDLRVVWLTIKREFFTGSGF